MKNRFLVIMAGGRGERFWPQSRLRRPKHLLPIVGDTAMLTQTVERLEGMLPPENVFIITNQEQREAVMEVCPDVPAENVVAEPVGRDTAAAVGLATVLVKRRNPEAIIALLPADHVIHDRKEFQKVLSRAFVAAERGEVLVTIGITPTEPATGYGYIQQGENLEEIDGNPVYRVLRFVEKPDAATAQGYLESGDYFWNAGMFVWSVGAIERAFDQYAPVLQEGLRTLEAGLAKGESLESLLETIYPNLQKISIDYAVMEKAQNVVTLAASFDWDDVGSWPAAARHFEADAEGNVSRGEVLLEGSSGNIVFSGGKHLVTALGVDDLIIIHTEDATLVCRKDRAQDIKAIVSKLGGHEEWKKLL